MILILVEKVKDWYKCEISQWKEEEEDFRQMEGKVVREGRRVKEERQDEDNEKEEMKGKKQRKKEKQLW